MIIALCVLLLFAYFFDISSYKTKIPSVILLLALGWLAKQITVLLHIETPNLNPILPILGTLGLILIVLDGTLGIEINKSKFKFIGKTSLIALLPILVFCTGFAFFISYMGNTSAIIAIANAIPFAIISSAIAIPSSQILNAKNREFITYESSLSDIYGVILFNFFTVSSAINLLSIGNFLLSILIILIVTFIATIGLAFLLSKIKHHVKFVPIIVMIVLVYSIAKEFHLPALIFILIFGLFLSNLDQFKNNKYIQKLQPDILNKEVERFNEIVVEIVFLIRSLFFLLFGFLIETKELLNSETILLAITVTFFIFFVRYIFLKIFKLPIVPLVYIAPRGLITILLFLTIPASQFVPIINRSLVIQVIILSALVMMVGFITNRNAGENDTPEFI